MKKLLILVLRRFLDPNTNYENIVGLIVHCLPLLVVNVFAIERIFESMFDFAEFTVHLIPSSAVLKTLTKKYIFRIGNEKLYSFVGLS